MTGVIESFWYPKKPETFGRQVLLSPLWLVSVLFRLVVAVRNRAYAHGWLRIHKVDGVKVVSVGNINVGGTGKTPLVIYLAQKAVERGHRVCVVSRGTGRRSHKECIVEPGFFPNPAEIGDEPALIAQHCSNVPILVGRDRVRLVKTAKERFGANWVILDDGMQHRRLHRDEEILVVDGQMLFGNGHLLPRGPLREPVRGLERATLIWFRNGVSQALSLSAPIARAHYEASTILNESSEFLDKGFWKGAKVVAVCAIARPSSFLASLSSLGLDVVEKCVFPDHHLYTDSDVGQLREVAARLRANIIMTEKDAVKLRPLGLQGWVLRLSVEVVDGVEHLERILSR